MKQIKKIRLFLLLGLALGSLSGCAAMNYPEYAQAQKDAFIADSQRQTAAIESLAQVAQTADPQAQSAAVMAIMALAMTGKSPVLEAPRESALERALGSAATVFAGLGGAALILNQAANLGGNISVDNGSNLTQGSGSGSSATSTPTVVEQPPPVVFIGE